MKVNSYSEFVEKIRSVSGITYWPALMSFFSAYDKINRGCSCSKSHRINTTKDRYTDVINTLTPEQITTLKSAFLVEQITFIHDNTSLRVI